MYVFLYFVMLPNSLFWHASFFFCTCKNYVKSETFKQFVSLDMSFDVQDLKAGIYKNLVVA